MTLESGDKVCKYYIQMEFKVMRKHGVAREVSIDGKEKRPRTGL